MIEVTEDTEPEDKESQSEEREEIDNVMISKVDPRCRPLLGVKAEVKKREFSEFGRTVAEAIGQIVLKHPYIGAMRVIISDEELIKQIGKNKNACAGGVYRSV
jgi:radical SAM superfamily enzyme with C-terminal helix-hairpin-helix motif